MIGGMRMSNAELCRILRRIISEKGISYNEVARIAGVSHATILSWLKGKSSPRVETTGIILNALGYRMEVVPM